MTYQVLSLRYSMSGRNELRLAAVAGNELIGVCTLANAGKVASTLAQLFVAPDWRGKGVGTAIVQRACAEAAELGATAIAAIVDESGPMKFWERQGFLPVHCEVKQTLVAKQLE